MQNRFTIVTPNYNMSEFLEDTITSVLSNLEVGDEYIVIDGGSNDNSLKILEKYSDKLKFVSESDNGYADAISKGFEKASNSYYCWINSGDILLKGSLNKARELLDNNYDLVYGNDYYIDEDGQIISYSFGGVVHFFKLMLFSGWTPLQDACFWKADKYWEINGINKEYKFAADYDFFLRLSKVSRIKYANTFFSAFRKHKNQKSISGSEQYKYERFKSQHIELESLSLPKYQIIYYKIICYFYLRIHTFILLPLLKKYYQIKFTKKL